MRAILINPETQTISEIRIRKGYKAIQKAIGCENFQIPYTFDIDDDLCCDEEGLFKPQKGGIIAENWCIPILGKVLIVGSKSNGQTTDARGSVEYYKRIFNWVSETDAETYRSKFN